MIFIKISVYAHLLYIHLSISLFNSINNYSEPHITMRTTKEGPEDCYGARTNDTLEILYVLTDIHGKLIEQKYVNSE